MNYYKKFISAQELMKRFNIDKDEYKYMVSSGLPVYSCAGISRHAIDEVYLWCEEHRHPIEDTSNNCNILELSHVFGVSPSVISKWEELGLPKKIITDRLNSNKRRFVYDIEDVKNWLRTQHKGVTL